MFKEYTLQIWLDLIEDSSDAFVKLSGHQVNEINIIIIIIIIIIWMLHGHLKKKTTTRTKNIPEAHHKFGLL